jgi:hypothetical protein
LGLPAGLTAGLDAAVPVGDCGGGVLGGGGLPVLLLKWHKSSNA